MTKTNLLNFNRPMLREYFTQLGEKPFHADQVIQWIHQYGYQDFSRMLNLSKKLREYLQEHAEIVAPKIARQLVSVDGTIKWALELSDGNLIEMVFIPEDDRGTLCISSQVGCPLACSFCATGKLGFKRNLTLAEIIGQVWVAVRQLSTKNGMHDRHVTNIVLMGMGEPLLNFDNVVAATELMMDDLSYSFSKYRVTLSTVGIVPQIYKLAEVSEISLAVSLHAPNDELRSQLMPINKQYPLKDLIEACKHFFGDGSRRKVSFEYVMLRGINDQPEHAKQLIKLLEGLPCKVNLIPFNAVGRDNPRVVPTCSTPEVILDFRNRLTRAGINTITRKTRGADIQAACGQLAGIVING